MTTHSEPEAAASSTVRFGPLHCLTYPLMQEGTFEETGVSHPPECLSEQAISASIRASVARAAQWPEADGANHGR
jgi:hypothetical protein